MTTVDKPATLAEALLALQADLPEVVKAETARVETQKGSFSYQYAGLSAVTAAILPRLAALGCVWICRPTLTADGRPVLAYSLRHLGGEEITGEYPMSLPPNATPQMAGSMISYARRYALLAVTGVAPEADDDDAALASQRAPAKRPTRTRKPTADHSDPNDDGRPDDDGGSPLTTRQRIAIMTGYTELGYGGDEKRDERLRISAKFAGLETLGSHLDLTTGQARRVLDGIAERRRAVRKETADA